MNIERLSKGHGIYQNYEPNPILTKYKSVSRDLIKLVFPLLGIDEIDAAIDWSISNRLTDHNVQVDNNYKNQTIDMTLLQVAKYIIEREPIVTTYGVMFKKHGEVPNPIYDLIDSFIKNRKTLKKEMFKHPKGSELFEKFNLLQLLAKIDANGLKNIKSLYRVIYTEKSCELLGTL